MDDVPAQARTLPDDQFTRNDRAVLHTLYELDQCNPCTFGRGTMWFPDHVVFASARALGRVLGLPPLSSAVIAAMKEPMERIAAGALPHLRESSGVVLTDKETEAALTMVLASLNNLVESALATHECRPFVCDGSNRKQRWILPGRECVYSVCDTHVLETSSKQVEAAETVVTFRDSTVYWRAELATRMRDEHYYAITASGRHEARVLNLSPGHWGVENEPCPAPECDAITKSALVELLIKMKIIASEKQFDAWRKRHTLKGRTRAAWKESRGSDPPNTEGNPRFYERSLALAAIEKDEEATKRARPNSEQPPESDEPDPDEIKRRAKRAREKVKKDLDAECREMGT